MAEKHAKKYQLMGDFATVKTNMLDFQCYRADRDGYRPAVKAG
jgi:hypothetical protein